MARIVIIEDSASQAAIISEIVAKAGHEPSIISDVSRGVAQLLRPIDPQMVLLDLVLLDDKGKPAADGFQVCREIKRFSKGKIKVVVISAKGDEESTEWAILQGADAFLQKPFAVEDLLSVIDEVLVAPASE